MKLSKKYIEEAFWLILGWLAATTWFSYCLIAALKYYDAEILKLYDIEKSDILEYIISPIQYVEGFFFAVFFGVMHFITHRLTESSGIARKSFGQVILIKSGLYVLAFIIVIGLTFIVLSQLPFVKPEVWNAFWDNSYAIVLLFAMISFWLFFIILFNFILAVSQKFGPKNFIRLFSGKYHDPKTEERIFMFLDLKSSTKYAEVLGHKQYSQMIQDCIRDINQLVDLFEGEIYQYVGDEVVISWKFDHRSKVYRSIEFFFAL